MLAFVRGVVLSRLETVASRMRGWAVTAVLYLLIAVLAIISLAFLHAAAHRALSQWLGAVYALLIVGSVYAAAALIVLAKSADLPANTAKPLPPATRRNVPLTRRRRG